MVSTHLKNSSQNWSFPQVGVKIKKYLKFETTLSHFVWSTTRERNIWNHHLDLKQWIWHWQVSLPKEKHLEICQRWSPGEMGIQGIQGIISCGIWRWFPCSEKVETKSPRISYPPWNEASKFAPENGWLEYDPFLLGFRSYVSFREGRTWLVKDASIL